MAIVILLAAKSASNISFWIDKETVESKSHMITADGKNKAQVEAAVNKASWILGFFEETLAGLPYSLFS